MDRRFFVENSLKAFVATALLSSCSSAYIPSSVHSSGIKGQIILAMDGIGDNCTIRVLDLETLKYR